MKETKFFVKPRRVVEFILFFVIALGIRKVVYRDKNEWDTIIFVVAAIAIVVAIVFIIIEVRSNESIDTGKAISEYEFKSSEEMQSMPSNFWYNRAVTNKRNTLISPELIAGAATALVSKNVFIAVLVAVLFWIVDYGVRAVFEKKREGLLRFIGSEGKALTNLAWEGAKYLGSAEIDGNPVKVKIEENSEPVSVGDIIQVIGLDGTKYIVRKKG